MTPSSDGWGFIGDCDECGAPFERVRPGKTQPTCRCQDKCDVCGTMRQHFAQGEIAKNMSGFLCPQCDADKAPSAVSADDAPRPRVLRNDGWDEFRDGEGNPAFDGYDKPTTQ